MLSNKEALDELFRVEGLFGIPRALVEKAFIRQDASGRPLYRLRSQGGRALERAVTGKKRYEGVFMFGDGKPKTESKSDADDEGEGNARGPRTVDAAFLEHWPRHDSAEERQKQSRSALDLYSKRAISRGTLSKILYLNAAYELGYSPKSMYFLRGKNDGFPALSTTYLTRPPSGCEESKVGLVKAHLMKASLGDMATHYLGLTAEGRKGAKRARE